MYSSYAYTEHWTIASLLLSQVSYHNAYMYNNHEEACRLFCRFINQIDYMYTLVAIVLLTFMLQYSYEPIQLYSAHKTFICIFCQLILLEYWFSFVRVSQ